MALMGRLTTESRNEKSMTLDRMEIGEILRVINEEDKQVAIAVERALPAIELAVERIVSAFKRGGRLLYIGAGTSGRMGVLDAAECVPTFGVSPQMVQAIIAGGDIAMTRAVEEIEDDEERGAEELRQRTLTADDVVVGIAASGRTPFVIGALRYARAIGAYTVGQSCNAGGHMGEHADCMIETPVGPEVLTGSTRMKCATAQKMVLNMLSTASFVRLGKTYENLMVDVVATNIKLIERSKRIVMHATGASFETAESYLDQAGQDVKTAIVMLRSGADADAAREALAEREGNVREAIDYAHVIVSERRNKE